MRTICKAFVVTCLLLICSVSALRAAPPASQPGDTHWVPVGKDAYKDMKDPRFSADKMSATTIFVDRATGDVFLSMWRNGVWKSSDAGKTFARIDGGKISNAMGGPAGGRGVCIDLEAGKKIAIFNMGFPRVGPSGYTTDGGATWEVIGHADNVKDVESIEPGKFFEEHLRDWEFGAVDWDSMAMIGIAHETTKVFLSTDAGKTWALPSCFEGPEGVGILGPKTLLVAGYAGIQRSEDAGKTWTTVCRLGMRGSGPAARFRNATWWLCQGKKAVIVSTDKGKTWSVQGTVVPGDGPLFLGPLFGTDENHVVVACKSGFFESRNGCTTWQLVTALPTGYGEDRAAFGAAFDPVHDAFYVAGSSKPVMRYMRSSAKRP